MTHLAIANLYSIFSKYNLNERVTGHYCPVCLSEDDNLYFHSTSLNSISTFRLANYFLSAGILDGNLNDFKYFLPRILEIVYQDEPDESWFFDNVWWRLAEANYALWDNEEVFAVNLFFESYLDKQLQSKDKELIQFAIENLKEVGYNGQINLENII